MTAHGAQTVRQARNEKLSNYKIAFKHATTVYSREKEKKGGMPAQDVSDLIKNQFKESISARTIQRHVKNGQAGSSPVRRGPKGSIPEIHYKNLLMAFESFVVINQLNGMAQETRHKKLALRVHQVLHTHTPAGSKARDFLKRVLHDSAVNLNAAKGKNWEDSRIRLTTYKNLLLWFDYWERDLVELGFAYYDPITNKVCTPEEQLINILNFDETCMSMDGSTQNRGGQPEVVLYDPRFPQVGKATSKSSLTSTMITGSSAAGGPIPPHLQFQSKAKTKETMKLQYDVIDHMPRVGGQFGFAEVRLWPVTFGAMRRSEWTVRSLRSMS